MSKRLLNLDTLRGLAALLVVWQHSSEVFIQIPNIALHGTGLANFISQLDFGRIGVLCFFLLSGYVIPHSLLEANRPLKSFAIRRFFRLYPTYWVSLIIAVGFTWLFADHIFSSVAILANTTMLQGLLGFENVQKLYWTLTAELIFYLLCAMMFALKRLGNPKNLLLLCWAALSLFICLQLFEHSPALQLQLPVTITYIPYGIAVMFCGALLRCCFETKRFHHYAVLAIASTFSIPILVLSLHLFGNSISSEPVRFGLSHLIALGIFLSVISLPSNSIRHFATLGTISYSIYLFHLCIIYVMKWSISQPWGQVFSGFPLSVYLSVTTLASIALATLIYWLIERPFVKLGRTLSTSAQDAESAQQQESKKVAIRT
ncbi:acyltransferase [Microbulbifer sp. GL-2]|uniref:acyltransferase family protein n=1 Tax=Microbulbifer sp. GL-2 TaxID=2591606 RepID=UPI00117D037C|nr:acyltransferase [Microbulbifer sp. GL-2]